MFLIFKTYFIDEKCNPNLGYNVSNKINIISNNFIKLYKSYSSYEQADNTYRTTCMEIVAENNLMFENASQIYRTAVTERLDDPAGILLAVGSHLQTVSHDLLEKAPALKRSMDEDSQRILSSILETEHAFGNGAITESQCQEHIEQIRSLLIDFNGKNKRIEELYNSTSTACIKILRDLASLKPQNGSIIVNKGAKN